MKITFNTQPITVIFKDGSFASFEYAIKWYKNIDFYDIFFVVNDNLNYCKYECSDVATIVFGLIDNAI